MIVQSDAPDFDAWAQVLVVDADKSAVTVGQDVRRARFRNEFFKQQLLKADEVVTIPLRECERHAAIFTDAFRYTTSAMLLITLLLSIAANAVVFAQSRGVTPTETTISPVQIGTLPRAWRPAGPNCLEVPDWEVHEYNENFFILRESGCINYEKPFLFLLFGTDAALLEDTGAGTVDTAAEVMLLITKWSERTKRTAPLHLIVIHSHGHGDHTAGDAGFNDKPNVRFVAATVPEVRKAAGIQNWPSGLGRIDLGNRIVDVVPIPGHEPASIALYDRQTGILLSGDTLYPGRLYVSAATFPAFAASIQRLVDFVKDKPVAHVLGTHVEQTRTPFMDYPRGTVYQPDEHPLELSRGNLLELNDALIALKDKPAKTALRDLTIYLR